jgi:hypothetical protein
MVSLDRKRSLLLALVLAVSVVAIAVGLALRGGAEQASAAPAPELQDGRQFGLIESVDLRPSPGTVVFDPADQLTGAAANRAAAAHGDEVPVPNDVYKVDDDPTVHTLALSPDVAIRVIDWKNCCDPVAADLGAFKASFRGRDGYWGFWVTLDDGVVVKIEEQYHP